jgi:FtsP/CotA-like multicopper oxidase with cupredoxin domain
MVVNGKIWPKADVEPRNYRLRLLNGCDSRFMAIKFCVEPAGFENTAPNDVWKALRDCTAIPYLVIGSDQGLAYEGSAEASLTYTELLFEPGSRYDVIFNFTGFEGERIIMTNMGPDEPFNGQNLSPTDKSTLLNTYLFTNMIMRFDVALPLSVEPDDFNVAKLSAGFNKREGGEDNIRDVALF